MKKIVLGFFIISVLAFSTTSYLCKNTFTKELYWAESGKIIEYNGLFFFSIRSEEKALKLQEEFFIQNGYRYTTFPYKIDILILFIFIFSIYIYLKSLRLINLKMT